MRGKSIGLYAFHVDAIYGYDINREVVNYTCINHTSMSELKQVNFGIIFLYTLKYIIRLQVCRNL